MKYPLNGNLVHGACVKAGLHVRMPDQLDQQKCKP